MILLNLFYEKIYLYFEFIFRIENIRVEDRGEVSCTLNLKSNPQHLNHTLNILGKNGGKSVQAS